jgi:hypothetical protein
MRALLAGLIATFAIVVAAPVAARADDTFEAKAAGAQVVGDLGDLTWALTATCDHGTDTEQRQCRHVRDTRASALAGATLLVDAEPDALHVGVWNPAKKSVTLTLTACVRCGGVQVDDKTLYVVGGNAPHVEAGRVKASVLQDGSRPFSDEAAAKAWLKSLRRVRVQLLLKVPDKVKWKIEGKEGVLLDVLGYRVVTPCDGGIVIANPPAQALDPDKDRCRAATAEVADISTGSGPDALSQSMVQTTMKPVVDAADACFERYGVAGTLKLMITIASDGTVVDAQQVGDFQDTPTGKCVDRAMAKVRFPASKKGRTVIGYPIVLQ